MSIFTLTVTFEDGVQVSEEFETQDEGLLRFHRYVRDAREHDNDGVSFTAKEIELDEFDGRKIALCNVWQREQDSLQEMRDVTTLIACQEFASPTLFPTKETIE